MGAVALLWPSGLLVLLALFRPFGPEGPLYVLVAPNTPGLEPGLHLTFAGRCLLTAAVSLGAGMIVHLLTRFVAARIAIGLPLALGLCALVAIANLSLLWTCLSFIPLFEMFLGPLLALVFLASIFAPFVRMFRSSAEPSDVNPGVMPIDARLYPQIQDLLISQPGVDIRCFVTLEPSIRALVEPAGITLELSLTLARILSCAEYASNVRSVLIPMADVDAGALHSCKWERRIEKLTRRFFSAAGSSTRPTATVGDFLWLGPFTHAMALTEEIAARRAASQQVEIEPETSSKTFFAYMAWYSGLWRERAKRIEGNLSIEFVEALRRGEFNALDDDWEDPDLESVDDEPAETVEMVRLNFQPEIAAITWFPIAEQLELELSRRLQHDSGVAVAPGNPLAVQ